MPRLCRAELAAAVDAAEVRRLVPAVARAGQRLHDLLGVALHRLRPPEELGAVRVGESRSGLRLELVAGEVLRLQPQGVREVRVEIGGALARDPVDEIEGDVVEPGITQSVHCASDVVGPGNALEHCQQVGRNDCAPRDTRLTPCSRSTAASSGVTVSGFASTVTSSPGRQSASTLRSATRLRERRSATTDEDCLHLDPTTGRAPARARPGAPRHTARAPNGARPR